MKKITISSTLLVNGLRTTIDSNSYNTIYPVVIWKSVPIEIRLQLAQTISYFVTRHLVLSKKATLEYLFPPPAARLLVDYGMFYSMAEAPFEFPEKKLTTSEVLKSVYNAEFSVRFQGIPLPISASQPRMVNNHHSFMPMSFGKDSLLTYALASELSLSPQPIFIEEPTCPYQNKKKKDLLSSFNKEFKHQIITLQNTLGNLRQGNGMMWGWDMLLTQYTALILPFVYYHKAAYLFWSNEQSTNEQALNHEGFRINSTHEQSVQWTLHLNTLYRLFGVNTNISSLLEPLHELMILSILHNRYQKVGKYQLSCDEEKTSHRWCGKCFECARVYLFFSALGIDPKSVGLEENMFTSDKEDLFYLFSKNRTTNHLDIIFQSYSERLLAFYMAYKRGIKGALIDKFAKTLLPLVLRKKSSLIAKYFSLNSTDTIPKELRGPLLNIFNEELKRAKTFKF